MKSHPTRRQVTQAAVLLAAAPLLGSAAEGQPPVDPLKASAQALLEIVRLRHGKYLTEEQLKPLEQSLARNLANAERMKRVPLANGDEPACIFLADLP